MKKIVWVLPIIVSIILGAVGYLYLPDVVAIQIGLDGQPTNTVPKLIAILIPIIITSIGSIRLLTNNENKSKDFILVIVGIGVMIITFIFNIYR